MANINELSEVELDLTTDQHLETDSFLEMLQKICDQYKLQIIGLLSVGPGGGHPAVTFKGKTSDVHAMIIEWYMEDDSVETTDWIKEYVTVSI